MSIEGLPDGYGELLAQVKADVLATRLRATRIANAEMVGLYWRVGQLILDRQTRGGWGSRVIDRLSADLRRDLPDQRGWSRTNLTMMRALAETWPNLPIGQHPVNQLPWGHIVQILGRVSGREDRDWYVAQDAANGWTRKVLEHHIATDLHSRAAAAPSNFEAVLDDADSELAAELVRDPYVFDFLGLTRRATERDVEQAMMNRLQDTLLELGNGFAFVGRQVRLEVDGDEFFIDLLLFNVEQLRYAVVELKIDKFKPEYTGQLSFYVTAVDDKLRRPGIHAPTVGILLCAGRNDAVVRYALQSTTAPVAVSTYTYDKLPPAERAALPAAKVIEAAFRVTAAGQGQGTGTAELNPDDDMNDGA